MKMQQDPDSYRLLATHVPEGVPNGWQVKRLKFVSLLSRGFDLASDQFVEGPYPILGSNGIIGYHNKFTTKGPSITVGRSGSVAEVNFEERSFWAHNTALYIRDFLGSYPRFIYYLLLSLDLKSLASGSAVGTLNRNYVHDLVVAIPHRVEQIQIANFLDNHAAKIDALIAKKQRLIVLLNEKRAATISHAVTKGLDPTVPMKHSGIEWLGDIPEHWGTCQVKRVARTSYGLALELDRTLLDGTPILSLPNVSKDGRLLVEDVPFTTLTEIEKSWLLLRPGDLLFNWRNGSLDHLGKTAYFDLEGEFAHVSFLLRIRFNAALCDSRYFYSVLNSLRYTGFFASAKCV